MANLPEAEATAVWTPIPWNHGVQAFFVVSGALTVLQVYKVQEAVGDGASAMIQEVTTGTSQVFSSFFDGINNTMKVSMLMIGICFVSMLGHWLQVVAYSWWVSKHQRTNTALAIDDGAEALPSLRPTSLDGTVLSLREVSATLSEPLCGQGRTSSSPVDSTEGIPGEPGTNSLPTNGSAEVVEKELEGSSTVFPQTGPGGPSTGKIARLTLEHIVRCIWLRDNDGTSLSAWLCFS